MAGARARILVSGMGGLSRPAIPDIPGLDTFAGTTFHSQQWRHDYPLAGKRVAVIGTGASAIQFVPQIAPQVDRLDLYQRTPPWVMPKPDRDVSALERWMFRQFPFTQWLVRAGLYWMLEMRVMGFVMHPKLMKAVERMARRHLAREVRDPELRAKLTPDYTIGCKRVLMSNDYYGALTRQCRCGDHGHRPRGTGRAGDARRQPPAGRLHHPGHGLPRHRSAAAWRDHRARWP
jgi:cation diffusion facilitator CzcD-associated flavoprotein CzcO